jgi:ABC-type sugar transport system substrate-binding protein
MRGIFKALLVALCLLVIAGTAFAAGGGEKGAAGKGKITVAGVVLHEDQQHKMGLAGYKQAAEDAGFNFVGALSQTDAAKEVELANTYLNQGVKGLAIIPINPQSSVVPLKQVADKGMKIAISDNPLVDMSFTVGTVLSDNFAIGQATGKAAREFIEKKLGGKAIIGGLGYYSLMPESSGSPNAPGGPGRWDGFLSEVTKLPGVKVVAYQDAWVQDKAVVVGGDMITARPEINLLFSSNEGGTIGLTMAVANAGLQGKVWVFGVDGSEQIVNMLKDPKDILQATTAQDFYMMCYKTMEIVCKAVKGEDISQFKGKKTYIGGTFLSRQEPAKLDEFVAKLKKYGS